MRNAWRTVLFVLAGSGQLSWGQLIYVPNSSGGNLSIFAINAETGSLTESALPIPTPGRPTAVAVGAKGKYLCVGVNPPAVATFGINAATGGLTFAPSAVQTIGGTPLGVSVDPSGKYLYAANQGGGNVVGFSINEANGGLTRIAGTPWAAGQAPSGILVEPNGKFVYVTNERSNNVSAYALDAATGALTAVAGSPFAAGQRPSRLAADGAGKYLYVTNQGSDNVAAYAIHPTTGALTPAPGSPFATGAGPTSAAVDPTGSFLYVANGDAASVSGYRIDAGTGALTPLSGSPFRTKRGPFAVLFDSTGKYLYVPNLISNSMSAFAVDLESGGLSPLPGAPFAAGNGPARPALLQLSQPVLPPLVAQSVLNAASRALPGLPNYGVAQGATFVVSGQNIGPGVKKTAEFPLSAKFSETSVEVTMGSVKKSALVVSTSSTEVTAVLPSDTPLGDGTVTVTYNGRTSRPVPIRVVNASFGIFTRNQAGSGAAVAWNVDSETERSPNDLAQSARPGQKMVLFGTGLGAVSFDETQAPPFQNLREDVEVWVGNKRAEVSYSGRSPQSPGTDEIGFTIPAGVTPGCYVPVAVKLGTPAVVSNFATVAVAAEGGICADPHGLSSAELAPLASGQTLNVGFIQLVRVNVTATIPEIGAGSGLVDSGWGTFFRWDAAAAASEQGMDLFSGRGTSLGACAVYPFRPGGPGWITWRANVLDGGPALSLAGPKGSGTLALSDPGFYEAHKALGTVAPAGIWDRLPPPYLEPGKITVSNGGGGADVQPFKAVLAVPESPAALDWTNFENISAGGVNRSTDLTVTWTGGDAAGEYVVISGAVALPNLVENMKLAAGFVCAERADAGRFTVPSAVLSALPASNPDDPTSAFLMVGRAPLVTDSLRFAATGLDVGLVSFAQFKVMPTAFR